MARLRALKDAANPRGRPATLPYVRASEEKDPEPVARFHGLFFWGEAQTPVHVVGERWHQRDARCCSAPAYPAPDDPSHLISMYGIDDVTGQIIREVSSEEYLARIAAILSGTQALRPGKVRLQGS